MEIMTQARAQQEGPVVIAAKGQQCRTCGHKGHCRRKRSNNNNLPTGIAGGNKRASTSIEAYFSWLMLLPLQSLSLPRGHLESPAHSVHILDSLHIRHLFSSRLVMIDDTLALAAFFA